MKRWWFIGLIAWNLVSPANAGDWPQVLGPTRNGVAADTAIATVLPSGGFTPVWTRPTGPGYSGPIVVGDRVLLHHHVNGKDRLECFDRATGTTRWRTDRVTAFRGGMFSELGPRATPAISENRVITVGGDAVVECHELTTGKRLWDYAPRPAGDDVRYFGYCASPLIDGDVIYLHGCFAGAAVVALDLTTGKLLWSAGESSAGESSPVMTVVGGAKRLLQFGRRGLHLIDPVARTEKAFIRWRPVIDASVNAAIPVVVDNTCFISASYGCGALLVTIKDDHFVKQWSGDEQISAHFNTPLVYEGHLFGIDGRQEGGSRLRCVRLADGKVQWTHNAMNCSQLIRVGAFVLALEESGHATLFDATPKQYQERWRFKAVTPTARAFPAFADGQYIVRGGRELALYNLR